MDSKEQAGTAPERIWLQHGADDPAEMTAEEWKSGEVSWCWKNIHGNDTEYIRADLARPSPAASAAPNPSTPEAGNPVDLEQLLVELVASGICFGAATSEDEEKIHSKSIEDWKAAIRAHLQSALRSRTPGGTADIFSMGQIVDHATERAETAEDKVRILERKLATPALPREALDKLWNLGEEICLEHCEPLDNGSEDHCSWCKQVSDIRATLKGESHV